MEKATQPFVSVVTPVFNGEKYLSECIKSVIEQTYENWEYIILDNCSTDESLEIARDYARKDERIKIYTTDRFLQQIPNWNEAMRKISLKSKYCKVVHADDWLASECLEKMVERAEEYPSAGIISSYRYNVSEKTSIRGKGLPVETEFLSGKEAARLVMQKDIFLFGSPSTLLYRADLVRANEEFYNISVVHADTIVCFELLQDSNFAFVHKPLSYTRRHAEATSNFCAYYNTYSLLKLYIIKNYGSYFLNSEEYERLLAEKFFIHHRVLANLMIDGRGKAVWDYHKKRLDRMGLQLRWATLMKYFGLKFIKIKPLAKAIIKNITNFDFNRAGVNKTVIENKKKQTTLR